MSGLLVGLIMGAWPKVFWKVGLQMLLAESLSFGPLVSVLDPFFYIRFFYSLELFYPFFPLCSILSLFLPNTLVKTNRAHNPVILLEWEKVYNINTT